MALRSAIITRRRLGIINQNTSYSTAFTAEIEVTDALDQSQCVLYTKLPGEIRTRIFEYALASSDDLTKPYRPDRVYYRPGYHYHQKTDVSLLRTCKRIFSEARLMPVAQTEHTFWLFGGPFQMMRTKVNGMARFGDWTASLNEQQRQTVNYVHLFAQQHYLENLGVFSNLSPLTIATKQLTLTFRHSDWWSWESPAESSDKLGICPWFPSRVSHQAMLAQPLRPDLETIKEGMNKNTWGQQICQVRGLAVLKIEFEIDEVKKAQLQKVLERARCWRFPLEDDTNVVLEQIGEVRESSWEGLAHLKDDSQPVLNSPLPADPSWKDRPRRTYYVAEMTWKRVTGHR